MRTHSLDQETKSSGVQASTFLYQGGKSFKVNSPLKTEKALAWN